MDLIDDIDLKCALDRYETNVFPKFANLIDAVIAGAVDLKHVKAQPLRNLPAGVAYSARVDGWSMNAIERLGKDTCRRRFAGAAWTNE